MGQACCQGQCWYHDGFLLRVRNKINERTNWYFYDGKPWTQTPYMPVHKISTPPDFMLQPLNEGTYTILPTTFEPTTRAFFIIAKVDCDFRLTTK